MENVEDVDVVIVGGGLAGLSAALRLKDEQRTTRQGLRFVLLESDNRLGGRTLMRVDKNGGGYDCEFGGGYVGASQNYIQYLLRRFRIQTFRQYLRKDFKWLFQYSDPNRIQRLPGNDPLALPGGVNAQCILGFVDTLALDVRTYLPDVGKYPHAEVFDKMTVEEWITEQRNLFDPAIKPPIVGMSPDTEDAFRSAVRCAFSLEPRDISFFFLLYYAACAGSLAALVDVAGGEGAAEGTRLSFGTQGLVNALFGELDTAEVQKDARVSKIVQGAESTTVHTDKGSWRAKHVIVAMSPPASAMLTYEPPLEDCGESGLARVALCGAMGKCLGRTIKGFVRFKDAFWRDPNKKLMGFLLSAGPKETCPVSWTLDNVWDPSDKHFEDYGRRSEFALPGHGLAAGFIAPAQPENPTFRLMTFIVGEAADYWSKQKPAERAAAVIEQLKPIYGFDDADLFDSKNLAANYQDEDWLLRAKDGIPAPAAMMPPNTLTRFGAALRTPVGSLHWAGSESSQEWCGYMSGAIESGFRAANEVLKRLV